MGCEPVRHRIKGVVNIEHKVSNIGGRRLLRHLKLYIGEREWCFDNKGVDGGRAGGARVGLRRICDSEGWNKLRKSQITFPLESIWGIWETADCWITGRSATNFILSF
jgi:hypothetical protein